MNDQVVVSGKSVTLRCFTVKDKIEIDQLQRKSVLLEAQTNGMHDKLELAKKEGEIMDAMWAKYFKILTAGTNLSREDIESLAGNDVDNLLITVLEHNKPPLELQARLSTLSTQDNTQS